MKNHIHILARAVLLGATALALRAAAPSLDTSWLPARPEVLTYRSTSPQGSGLYQLSLVRKADGVEHYINIITPNFTKSVFGTMSPALGFRSSRSRIYVHGQVGLATDCDRSDGQIKIATTIAPYGQVQKADLAATASDTVIDFSQTPLVPRSLTLAPGESAMFSSVNPRENRLVPLKIKCLAEETVQGIACRKFELHDYEGASFYWVEKDGARRIIRVEQPETTRVTELML